MLITSELSIDRARRGKVGRNVGLQPCTQDRVVWVGEAWSCRLQSLCMKLALEPKSKVTDRKQYCAGAAGYKPRCRGKRCDRFSSTAISYKRILKFKWKRISTTRCQSLDREWQFGYIPYSIPDGVAAGWSVPILSRISIRGQSIWRCGVWHTGRRAKASID
jgi:hypothetical protein